MRLLEGIIYNIYTYYSVLAFRFLHSLVIRVCTMKSCWEATGGTLESCVRGSLTIEMIEEEDKIKQEDSRLREWTEEDEDEMGNMVDSYYEL